jgi:hypothetical protein
MLQAGKSRVRTRMRSLDFSINLPFQPHYGPEVDSAFNRNVSGIFLGSKGRLVRKADNLTTISEPIV